MTGSAGRNFGLDLLRALAILIVLANHLLLGMLASAWPIPIEGWVAHLSTSAILSIEWLFVLSGFLIGNMMVRSFEAPGGFWVRARSFWLRRWFRTMPNYYLFLGLNAFLLVFGIGSGSFSPDYFVFAQNLVHAQRVPEFYSEAWSLALDEWFYLVAPPLVGLFALLARRSLRTSFLMATAVLILVPMALRAVAVPSGYAEWDHTIRKVTVMHLDATGWGVLAAVLSRWHPAGWRARPGFKALAGLALTILGVYVITGLYTDGWIVTHLPRLANSLSLGVLPAGAFLALPWITALRWKGLDRPVRFLSTYSYSIYLCHVPLLYLVVHDLGDDLATVSHASLLGHAVLWAILVLATSVAVYHAFEKPVSDLRERFTRKVDANPFAT